MIAPIYIGESNLIQWYGMFNAGIGEYVTNAIVTLALRDRDDNSLPGADNLQMNYVEGSQGTYQGTIPRSVTLTLVRREYYWIDITAFGNGDALRRIKAQARFHRST